MKVIHQAIATPILYDFYNYDVDKKEFAQLLVKFTQVTQHISLEIYHLFHPCLVLLDLEWNFSSFYLIV